MLERFAGMRFVFAGVLIAGLVGLAGCGSNNTAAVKPDNFVPKPTERLKLGAPGGSSVDTGKGKAKGLSTEPK